MKQVKKKSKAASNKPKSGRKQASTLAGEAPPTVTQREEPNWIEKLDIDRVHDPTDQIRALLTPEDCVRLVNQGFEVRLHNAYPVEPLNPSLIQTDDSVKRWFDAKVQSIKGARRQKESKRT
jgi:hypothetical protein